MPAEGHRAHRVPVEGLPAPHHDGLRRLAPLEPVLAGELGGVLGRLGPAGHEPHPVEVPGGELGHGLGQGLERLAREEVRSARTRPCGPAPPWRPRSPGRRGRWRSRPTSRPSRRCSAGPRRPRGRRPRPARWWGRRARGRGRARSTGSGTGSSSPPGGQGLAASCGRRPGYHAPAARMRFGRPSSHSASGTSASRMISSLPLGRRRTRPGRPGESGMTSASREMPRRVGHGEDRLDLGQGDPLEHGGRLPVRRSATPAEGGGDPAGDRLLHRLEPDVRHDPRSPARSGGGGLGRARCRRASARSCRRRSPPPRCCWRARERAGC